MVRQFRPLTSVASDRARAGMRNAQERSVRPDLCTRSQEADNPIRLTTLTDANHEAEIRRLAIGF